VAGTARDAGGRISWFAMVGEGERPEVLWDALATGGRAVCYEEEGIVLHRDGARQALVHISEVSATLGRAALVNVEDALAATAMAWCGGFEPAAIRSALVTFAPTLETLPGRLNLHRNGVFDVILDYAHCAVSLRALGDFVHRLDPAPRRVVALVGAPGDRRDEDIRAMGSVAAQVFDTLILREDDDPRGPPARCHVKALSQGCHRSRSATGAPDGGSR
jgi:cyanophycin synthetase